LNENGLNALGSTGDCNPSAHLLDPSSSLWHHFARGLQHSLATIWTIIQLHDLLISATKVSGCPDTLNLSNAADQFLPSTKVKKRCIRAQSYRRTVRTIAKSLPTWDQGDGHLREFPFPESCLTEQMPYCIDLHLSPDLFVRHRCRDPLLQLVYEWVLHCHPSTAILL
jgi:hypothetical protein